MKSDTINEMQPYKVSMTVIRGYDMLGNPSYFETDSIYNINRNYLHSRIFLINELARKQYPAAESIKITNIKELI